MANRYDFGGRAAVVTGGAQGIGRATVERLVQGGARVAIWDQDVGLAGQAASEIGEAAIPVAVNVTDLDAVEAARDETVERLGKIDILVNNAGVAGQNATVIDYSPAEWDRVLKINLTGQFNCCRSVAPLMVGQNWGRIVNVASIAGKDGNPNASAYSVSKAGVIALTKSLGKELANYDISVNCVTPAAAKTAIFDQMTEEHINYMLSKIPRGRFVTVDEVASIICFAASPDCSFTTGAVFDVSGGRATY